MSVLNDAVKPSLAGGHLVYNSIVEVHVLL